MLNINLISGPQTTFWKHFLKMLAIGHMKICYAIWILKKTRIFRFQYGIFLRQCTFLIIDKSKIGFWLDSIFLTAH